jgi:hypothetical protein
MTNIAKTYLDKCEDYKHGRISLNELIRFHDKNRKAIIQAANKIKEQYKGEEYKREEEVQQG